MARAVEEHWPDARNQAPDHPLSGLVVTRYRHAVPCRRIEIVEAGHPHPDASGLAAAREMLRLVHGLGEDDLVLALISGGGSSLLPCPAPGLTLADEQALNRLLVDSGASIGEMNCVRKHVSAIKGGRLARAAWPARVLSLVISDVPGDTASDVASGPTLADPTTVADALAVIGRHRLGVPKHVLTHLQETPKPGDPQMARAGYRIVARAQDALDAAAAKARAAGMEAVVLGDAVEGEARDVAREHAAFAKDLAARRRAGGPPCVILSGGETTVTVTGKGRGGRNAEYALALALALDGAPDIHAFAADTDGIDGTEDNAGAVIAPDTLTRARALGLDAQAHLADNDAYGLFEALGDLVVTGPTLTNVNDFRAILVA